MGFGLFKSKDCADVIFFNGNIYTNDPDFPWASAVAVKDGEILAVGDIDGMDDIMGSSTEQIDLEGKYMFPGFIDIHRSPVMQAFEGLYCDLHGLDTTDEIVEAMSEWAEEHDEKEVLFGYGYSESFDTDEDILDQIDTDLPILLLCENNLSIWTNSIADDIIQETADEECVDVVTPPYVLNLLLPFSAEEIEDSVKAQTEKLVDGGFTSVLNLQTPNFFETLYRDSLMGQYNEDGMKQRFFGSYFANRPLNPQSLLHMLMTRRTDCIEMGDMMNADILNLYLDNSQYEVSMTALVTILSAISERGFITVIEAISHEDLLLAYKACEEIRAKYSKNIILIASDAKLTDEEKSELVFFDTIDTTWGTNIMSLSSIYGEGIKGMDERIAQLTTIPARLLGMEDKLGSIEKGKYADFVVYEEDLFHLSPNTNCSRLHAEMTVLGGEIVYDANAEYEMELFDMMSHIQM